MTFAQDRDLLAACPDLLTDVTWTGQTPLDTTNATLTDGALSLSSGSFTNANITAGSVLLVDGVPREVLTVSSATACDTSLIRSSTTGNALPGPDASAAAVTARTFAPQREAAYEAVLMCLGIDPSHEGAQDTIDSIMSVELMRRLEVFKALETLYALAAGTETQNTAWRQRSAFYRGRFAEVFFHARVAFDLDGDGVAEQERSLHVLPTVRI